MAVADIPGAELYYEAIGDGPPIVVMHGGLGLDHTYFRPWLDPLAEDSTLVYYDHRGNGRSSRPIDWSRISHDTWARDADALRGRLGFERWVVMGHSYGGILALEYALRFPERVGGLVLVDTTPALDYGHDTDALIAASGVTAPEGAAAEARVLTSPLADDEAWRKRWNTIAPLYFVRFDADLAGAADAAAVYSKDAFEHAFTHCLPRYDVTSRLGEIRAPTLVIVGAHDWITPASEGERLARGVPGSELVVFEDAGHFPFIERQDAFLDTVRSWVARLPTHR